MRFLIYILLTAWMTNTLAAGENELLGLWRGNDRASAAIYGNILVTEQGISWGHTPPYDACKTTYVLVSTHADKNYRGT